MKQPPALLVRLEAVKQDPALRPGKRGARKILVTKLYSEKEFEAVEVAWNPPADAGRCPVQVTENIEVAIFTQNAAQDRHFHKIGTEMYMVLEGEMRIEVEGKGYLLLVSTSQISYQGEVNKFMVVEGQTGRVISPVKPHADEMCCTLPTSVL